MPLYIKRIAALMAALFAAALFLLPPVNVAAESAVPAVEAPAYAVIDAASGQVLIEKNSDKYKFPASVTKILSIALALEASPQDGSTRGDTVTVSERAVSELMPGASAVHLEAGEVTTFNDILYATQIVSANDAANVLAEYIDGSLEQFAARMNQKTAELGLANSHFTNPSGQPENSHYVTAYDMAQITRWALSVEGFKDIFGATSYTMGSTAQKPQGTLCQNRNLLLAADSQYYYPAATGGKMGFTNEAQFTLVTSAEANGNELICVVLDCATDADKYSSTTTLLDYCFNNFNRVTYGAKEVPATSISVFGGAKELGKISVESEDTSFLLHNSLDVKDVEAVCDIPDSYVMGAQFTPTVSYQLPADCLVQQREILTVPLTWQGLDNVLRASGGTWQELGNDGPAFFVTAVTAVTVTLVLGAVFIVARRRKDQERLARLAAIDAKRSTKVEPRAPFRTANEPTVYVEPAGYLPRQTTEANRPCGSTPYGRSRQEHSVSRSRDGTPYGRSHALPTADREPPRRAGFSSRRPSFEARRSYYQQPNTMDAIKNNRRYS